MHAGGCGGRKCGRFHQPGRALAGGGDNFGVGRRIAALAAGIRDQLASTLDQSFVKMAEAMQTLRPTILGSGLQPQERRNVFRDLTGKEAIQTLASGGLSALKRWIADQYPQLRDGLGD